MPETILSTAPTQVNADAKIMRYVTTA